MKFTDKFKLTDAERDQRLGFLHLARADFKVLAGLRKDIEQRLRIGEIHERIGVPLKWYIGSMGWFFARLATALPAAGRTPEALVALNKVMNLDLQLALESYASLSSRLKAMDQRIKDTANALNAVLDQDGLRS